MLDIKFIRENRELVIENCKNRNVKIDIDLLLKYDEERRGVLQKLEDLRALRNQGSKGKPSEEEILKMREVGGGIKIEEEKLSVIEEKYKDLLGQVSNLTHPNSPVGKEEDFVILKTKGKPAEFDFSIKDHEILMTDLDIIDFERGAKTTGSKFYFVKNKAVKLNQALINYGLDILEKHGFNLLETPDLIKNEILEGSGFNPRGEEKQTYEITGQNLSLIGTAEITTLGYHANEVLDLENGPIKYAALSHCFRTEAGSYGKASKGLYRVHQFTKLEMFIFCKPENSEKLHNEILKIEEEILDGLELPYRVIDIATGDLGGPAYRKFDIESYMPMLENYGEITSCSNCTDYQARRLNIKYKNEEGKNEFVHTLNGTAVVLSRFPLSLVENFQQKDGSIKIPKKLQKYCGFKKITK